MLEGASCAPAIFDDGATGDIDTARDAADARDDDAMDAADALVWLRVGWQHGRMPKKQTQTANATFVRLIEECRHVCGCAAMPGVISYDANDDADALVRLRVGWKHYHMPKK